MTTKLLNSEQRKALILERIASGELIAVADVAESMRVSEMTIRRDFSDLEKEGHLKRVHGGAVGSHGRSYEPPMAWRESQAVDAKRSIAKAAAECVVEGDSIALDVGSTCHEVARQLAARRGLTVVTASVRVITTLMANKDIRLIVAGGVLRHGEESLVGELPQQAFQGLFVDKLFLGGGGLDARAGLTEYNWDDALVKKVMIRSAKQVILVVDATKFDRIAFAKVADLKSIHMIITNKTPTGNLASRLKEANVAVTVTGDA
jgi:DeoR family fructose operon transcriptional repressor